jgi:hypothetical protein
VKLKKDGKVENCRKKGKNGWKIEAQGQRMAARIMVDVQQQRRFLSEGKSRGRRRNNKFLFLF